MISALILDFSNVLIFARDRGYQGKLNDLHRKLLGESPYNVFEYFELNRELLDLLAEIKLRYKLSVHLFTDGKMHRIPEVYTQLIPLFDSLHGSDEVGFRKNATQAYTSLTKTLHLTPAQTLFIDDKLENIDAANQAGLATIQYISLDELRAKLNSLGLS